MFLSLATLQQRQLRQRIQLRGRVFFSTLLVRHTFPVEFLTALFLLLGPLPSSFIPANQATPHLTIPQTYLLSLSYQLLQPLLSHNVFLLISIVCYRGDLRCYSPYPIASHTYCYLKSSLFFLLQTGLVRMFSLTTIMLPNIRPSLFLLLPSAT